MTKTETKNGSAAGRIIKRILLVIAVIAGVLLLAAFAIVLRLKANFTGLERVDGKGMLYSVEYTGNYYSPLVTLPFKLMKPVKSAGCSCFFAENADGQYLTGRNYDLAHLDKSGNTTGLNVVLKCSPEGKYSSVGIADAAWFSQLGVDYYTGALDDGDTSTLFVSLLPYLCMDGVNEKGLSAAILALDVKEGEHAVYQSREGRKQVPLPMLMRFMLDSCATVEEAEKLADEYDAVNISGGDFHLFVTDASGKSAVFEWRNDTLTVTYTDIVTNFYVSADDAEDCYYGDDLKEKYVPPAENPRNYRFGYGHGYERFKTIMSAAKEHSEGGKTVMSTQECADTLQAVSQEYTGELTSLTQYSAVYNNSEPGVDIWVYPDYSRSYHFE